MSIRTGHLLRHRDVSGVSGTGSVAEVVQLGNGKLVVGWLGRHPSVTVWDDLASIVAVHGHNGATVIRWSDGEVQELPGEDEACLGR